MSATHAEILRTLPPELLEASQLEGGCVRGAAGDLAWELELVPMAPLRIGMLHLAVTELVIRLHGYSDDERTRFIVRLEQYTRRGGG